MSQVISVCELPYNLEESIKLTNNNKQLAIDLLSMFVQELSQQLIDINAAMETKDLLTISKRIHKILGATSYVCTPKIRTLAFDIQKQIRVFEYEKLIKLITELNGESIRLTEYYNQT